ncbi:PqiC family protein [Andreprevotia chitinilytica]|uniref:PqiC family protein n=1 Tax=Andreprevotia chitinilytica TaxID=396808 RepID=UPI0014702FAC|nr:PqiC family protein [Andreprevotia chitinilytica]
MQLTRHQVLVSIGLAALLLAGCSTPQEHFYSLSAPDTAAAGTITGAVAAVVGPVTVPEALDRPQLLVRKEGELRVLDLRLWVQPLKSEIATVVAAELGRKLNRPVAVTGQSAASDAPQQVVIDIQRLDATLGGSVTLEALWRIRDGDGKVLHSGRSTVSDVSADASYEALVAAQRRVVLKLADEIGRWAGR